MYITSFKSICMVLLIFHIDSSGSWAFCLISVYYIYPASFETVQFITLNLQVLKQFSLLLLKQFSLLH